jgi:hypothetical protein
LRQQVAVLLRVDFLLVPVGGLGAEGALGGLADFLAEGFEVGVELEVLIGKGRSCSVVDRVGATVKTRPARVGFNSP